MSRKRKRAPASPAQASGAIGLADLARLTGGGMDAEMPPLAKPWWPPPPEPEQTADGGLVVGKGRKSVAVRYRKLTFVGARS